MAPITSSTRPQTPPCTPPRRREHSTGRKYRFFCAHEERAGVAPFASICADVEITTPCGRAWLRKREAIGSPAYRRTRKLAKRLGRKQKVSPKTIRSLVDPEKNPVQDQLYDAQIEYHKLLIRPRQLQRRLKQDTNRGQRYKCAFVKKVLSKKNMEERANYGKEHEDKSIEDFWENIFFTDEAHIDPTSQAVGNILREKGKRYNSENIQQRGEKKGVKFHVAAWITWHAKAEKLEFYNDEEEYTQRPPRLPKPRRWPTTESEEEYQSRIIEWEALLPHEQEVKPKGNAMTQKYYCERLLLVYIKAVQTARLYDSRPWILQEDGDPSHGKRKYGLAQQLKDENWINNLYHLAQSPDLNPMEGIWNILKQRLRRRVFHSKEEVKEALQEEWGKITMAEVRKRISSMPERCKELVRTGGKPIKKALW